jgi:hypothetical protein
VTGASVIRPDNRSPLRTGDLACLVGARPNTVRVHQERGLLPPVPSTPTGYRQFTTEHLAHLCLARLLLGGPGLRPRSGPATGPGGPVPAAAAARLGLTGETLRGRQRNGLLTPGRGPFVADDLPEAGPFAATELLDVRRLRGDVVHLRYRVR